MQHLEQSFYWLICCDGVGLGSYFTSREAAERKLSTWRPELQATASIERHYVEHLTIRG